MSDEVDWKSEYEKLLQFFGAHTEPDGSMVINMPKYHAAHLCEQHQGQFYKLKEMSQAERCMMCVVNERTWQPVETTQPPIQRYVSGQGWQPREKPYVLCVDAKGRMSVGYAMETLRRALRLSLDVRKTNRHGDALDATTRSASHR